MHTYIQSLFSIHKNILDSSAHVSEQFPSWLWLLKSIFHPILLSSLTRMDNQAALKARTRTTLRHSGSLVSWVLCSWLTFFIRQTWHGHPSLVLKFELFSSRGTHDQGKWEWVVTLEQSEDEITPGPTLCCPLNPESWGSVMSDLDGNVMDTLLAFEDWSMLHLPLYLEFHKKVLHRGMSHYTDICPDQAIYLVTTCSWRDGGCTIASHIM